MKRILTLIFIVLSFQTTNAQTKSNCTIEPGKGCGDIAIGKSRNDIETAFGKANGDRYYKNGFGLTYNTENKVTEITFFLNRNENIFQQYFAYAAGLPGNLNAQSTIAQITATYGKAKTTRSFDALKEKITRLEYPGLNIYFDKEQLFYVEVFATNEVFALANDQNIFEGEIVFDDDAKSMPVLDDSDGDGIKNADDACPNDKGTKENKGCPVADMGNKNSTLNKKETKPAEDGLSKLESHIGFGLPGETKTNAATIPDDKFEKEKSKIYLYQINSDFLYNANGLVFNEATRESAKSSYNLTDAEFNQLLAKCTLADKPQHMNTPEKIKALINNNQEVFAINAYQIFLLITTNDKFYSVIQIPTEGNSPLGLKSSTNETEYLYFLTPYSNVQFQDYASYKRNKRMLEETRTTYKPATTITSNSQNSNIATNKSADSKTCNYCKGKGFTYTYFCSDCKNTGYVYVIGYETKKEFCACIQRKRLFTANQIEKELKDRREKCEICNGSGKIK